MMKYHVEITTISSAKREFKPLCTAAEACKREGFDSLREVCRILGISETTLWRKFNGSTPEQFYSAIERAKL